MARIKVEDLPKDVKVSKEELRRVVGGDMIDSMHEMNRAFSLQYQDIQQKIQDETREFTLLPNIMQAKHDAAKNVR